MTSDHAMNLFSGRRIKSWWKSISRKLGGGHDCIEQCCPSLLRQLSENEVVDVVIGCALWVNVNFNNQLKLFSKWD
jgi:hypothetical protein